MDQEEREKRHALNYGLYNFQDVKKHFFTKEGWRATSGPALSYDHYYIKPGKTPKDPAHKQGVDYFLGEAELVAYARKMKIFGEEEPMQPLDNGRTHKRRARSSSSARTMQTTAMYNDGDSDSIHRPKHKHRRRSNENKVGSSVLNPIALSSDSSSDDDDTSNENADGSIDNGDSSYEVEEEEDEEEEEEEDESSGASTSSTSDDEPDYLDVVSRPRNGKSRVEAREEKRNEDTKVNAKKKAEVKIQSKSQVSAESDDDMERENNSRPLLKTSHKKLSTSKSSKRPAHQSVKKGAGKQNNKKKATPKGLKVTIGQKCKSAPRDLLDNTDTTPGGRHEDNDNSFDLGVEEFGESPPRRPPSRVHSRANSVISSPAPSIGDTSSLPDEHNENVLPAPGTLSSPSLPTTSPSVELPTTAASETTTSTSSTSAKNNSDDSNTSGDVSMELTQVALPPDCDNKYHIRVTVSGSKPPVHTIWMKNLSSLEQREYSFRDVLELPDAQTDMHVPTSTVLTALFRCLSSQPDAVVIVGPEPRATAVSKPASEKGKVQLRMSTAQKQSAEADGGGGDGLTLVVTYPALDLFSIDHNFPMKLVSTDQQHQRLTLEIKRLQEELALTQTDRDKLREQFLREENRFSQFKACTAAHQAQEKQRVAQLVEKKMQTIAQTQEKAKRDKDRARRWVFAQSDWMSAFQPCRSLIAGDTGTSLLRPGAAAVSRKHVVEWREVVEIAEPFFQPIATSEGGPTRSITVVKDGIYQVNASVSHDSLVEMRLVITPANETSAARRSTQTIAPTKVSLYDNKRRVSRVDKMLELHALDQLSLELVVLDSSTTPPGLDWLRTPMPSHNRFLIVILDEHALVPK